MVGPERAPGRPSGNIPRGRAVPARRRGRGSTRPAAGRRRRRAGARRAHRAQAGLALGREPAAVDRAELGLLEEAEPVEPVGRRSGPAHAAGGRVGVAASRPSGSRRTSRRGCRCSPISSSALRLRSQVTRSKSRKPAASARMIVGVTNRKRFVWRSRLLVPLNRFPRIGISPRNGTWSTVAALGAADQAAEHDGVAVGQRHGRDDVAAELVGGDLRRRRSSWARRGTPETSRLMLSSR